VLLAVCLRCTNISIFLAEPPVIRFPTSSPFGNDRTSPPPATWQLQRKWKTRWILQGGGKTTPAKGQLEEPLPAIARMLGDFLQHQRNSQSPTSSRSNMPIGIRSWSPDGAGKMAKHPWDEKEALYY